jgi:hypothetical protein
MYLTPTSLVPYLIGRGLVDSSLVVRGDLQVVEFERNNRCFKIVSRTGPSYFVKQIRERDHRTESALRREAAVYQLAANSPQFEPFRKLLPAFYSYDETHHAVIVEFFPDSENVHQYHNRVDDYPVEIGRLTGQSLGVFHSQLGREFASQIENSELGRSLWLREPPWILSFHKDQGDGQLSPANHQLLELMLADDQLQEILDQLVTLWRFDGLMHRDLKWNNVLFATSEANVSDLSVRILDWELADVGDWCWDAGMMLQNWWSFQTLAAPDEAPHDPEEFLAHPTFGFGAVYAATQEFWSTWISTVDISVRSESRFVEKCVQYAAARMLQTVYELLHQADHLSDSVLRLYRVSQFLLKNPGVAMNSLLGTEQN